MSESGNSCSLPLLGVRVVDTTAGREGTAGRFLADLGADVILVEPPGGADARRLAPLHEGTSLHFATHHAGKRGVTLDLIRLEDRDRLLALLDAADIWIEGGRPGDMADKGVNFGAVAARNPGLVILSISDFGQTGPYSGYTATERVHLALGGVLSRSGLPGLAPLLPPGSLATEAAAYQAAWTALLAYLNRLATGRGDHIDFSVSEAVAQVLDPGYGIGGSATGGTRPTDLPRGRPDGRHLYPIFACADGHVRVCLLSARQWRGMRAWLGEPEELSDPAYESLGARFMAADKIHAYIRELFRVQTRDELVEQGQRLGVPIAAVLTPREVLDAGHFVERGALADVEVTPGLTGRVPTGFLELDGVRAGLRRRAPLPGEHNAEVFAELDHSGDGGEQPASSPDQGFEGRRQPLSGLRVLDLGVIVAGAEAGRLLADFGADVVKVENRAFPDGSRQSLTGEAITASFVSGHRNKRGLGLNLRSPEGVALFKRLVAGADVVLSNFKPGTLESLGLGYDDLRTINPKIVMADSSAFGSWGPWSKRLGYGPLVRASTGLTSLWRYPDVAEGFSDATTIYPDHLVGRVCATAVLAQLVRCRRAGEGGTVGVSQAEVILTAMADLLLAESLNPGSLTAGGGTTDAPQGVYPCAGDDEWCAIDVRDRKDFERLCSVIGRPDLAEDAELATAAGRMERREEIEAALVRWTSGHEPRKVMELLQQAGVPAGAMLRVSDYPGDPHLSSRGFLTVLHQPGRAEGLLTEARPARFQHVADPLLGPAPLQGEHTREICQEWLGLPEPEIEELLRAGALEEGGSRA
ncbi:CaiB/BaiF CoA transferase family protein [Nonomuraea basaltis]|uniref:CaiB/BaiF CoA transferase family protein n=1 Tax=Nonomuraea basaltis TaxID=2495887 RepID=UPI00110C4420|nr:CoA transferase [Nonomuraea basaltis]TMR98440.1 CoA transferase [Nonomuraea basaltis]